MRVAFLNPVNARRTQSIAFKSLGEVAKQAEWKRHVDRNICCQEVGAEDEWIRATTFAPLNKGYEELWRGGDSAIVRRPSTARANRGSVVAVTRMINLR
jgi:hypothetical protein